MSMLNQDTARAIVATIKPDGQEQLDRDEFEREPRYCVFKIKDLFAYCTNDDIHSLQSIGEKVASGRAADEKRPFDAVVVEDYWPEFGPTWEAIQARVNGTPAAQPAMLSVQAMADRAEIDLSALQALPLKLLEVACHIRSGEALSTDDHFVDLAAHAIKGALLFVAPGDVNDNQV